MKPAAQIINKPPPNSPSKYLGFEVEELYLYLFAASIDTWGWEYNTQIDKFNGGLLMIKPSVIHFNLLMQTTYNLSNYFAEMEQSTLNYVYSRSENRPLPFSLLNTTYNFFPEVNSNFTAARKAYHAKLWRTDLPEVLKGLGEVWQNEYTGMKATYSGTVSILSDNVALSSRNDSITVSGLSLSSGTGTFFAVASINLKILWP
jgi:alpha-N-acetylglucosamine transferase